MIHYYWCWIWTLLLLLFKYISRWRKFTTKTCLLTLKNIKHIRHQALIVAPASIIITCFIRQIFNSFWSLLSKKLLIFNHLLFKPYFRSKQNFFLFIFQTYFFKRSKLKLTTFQRFCSLDNDILLFIFIWIESLIPMLMIMVQYDYD